MNEIVNVFNAFDDLELYARQLPDGYYDPKIKELFYELFKEKGFHSWEEFEGYINSRNRMMTTFSTKFIDLLKPTKDEFYSRRPHVKTLETFYDADDKRMYLKAGKILEFYNEDNKDRIEKPIPSTSFYNLAERYKVRIRGGGYFQRKNTGHSKFFMGDVENMLIEEEYILEPIFLNYTNSALEQINKG